jgi:PAP2 superfamily
MQSNDIMMRPLVASRHGGGRQFAFFGVVYVVYLLGRWLTSGDKAAAMRHARAVAGLERSLGIGLERATQHLCDQRVFAVLASYGYLAAQLVVVPVALVLTYRLSRPVYRVLRDTIVASWLLAIPVYAAFPVAPPRLSAAGMADTVSAVSAVALTGRSTIFYNAYAAVPSLHVGFAFAVSIALATVARRHVARVLALAWGPFVALVVIATGNHYVLDVAAGLAVTAMGYGVGALVRRITRRPHRLRDPFAQARCVT